MKEEEKEIEELYERRSALQSLTTHEGWVILTEIIEDQIQTRRNLEDSIDIEDLQRDGIELVRLKAERRTLMLIRSLPQNIVEQLDEDLEDLNDATRRSVED